MFDQSNEFIETPEEIHNASARKMECSEIMDEAYYEGWYNFETNPTWARYFFEKAIAAGDEIYATNALGLLMTADDPELAIELFERSIAHGGEEAGAGEDERGPSYNLALLIEDSNPERAAELYKMTIEKGDELYSTYRLGMLLRTKDPEKAKGLFARSAAAGNTCLSMLELGKLIKHANLDLAEQYLIQALIAWENRSFDNAFERVKEDVEYVSSWGYRNYSFFDLEENIT